MDTPSPSSTDRSARPMTPSERVKWLAKLSPLKKRRAPRSILFVGACIVAAILAIVLLAVFVSDQAAALVDFWIKRLGV